MHTKNLHTMYNIHIRPISCRHHSYVTRGCARIVVAETQGNKWSEMGKIHGIRDKMYCVVPLDVRIEMQIIFIEYCRQKRHLKLNADV